MVQEGEIHTRNFFSQERDGLYQSIHDKTITRSDMEELLSKLFKKIFGNSQISPKDIDFITGISDGFSGIEKIRESSRIFREIIDISEDVLDINPRTFTPNVTKIAANCFKSQLVGRGGMKIAKSEIQKNTDKIFIDLSSYLSGAIFSKGESDHIKGFLSGLGYQVLDFLAKGYSEIDKDIGNTSDLQDNKGRIYSTEAEEMAVQCSNIFEVDRVSTGVERVGKIPVNVRESYSKGIKLVGADVGKNGDDLNLLTEIGKRAASFGISTLKEVVEKTKVRMFGRIVKNLYDEEILEKDSDLLISGRGNIYQIRERLENHLENIGFLQLFENIVFLKNPESFGMSGKVLAIPQKRK